MGNFMKILLLFVFLLSIMAGLKAQPPNCTIESIPAKDKAALIRFWQAFKQGIIQNDKAALSKLCVFPMESTFTANRANDEVIITAANFATEHYKIFQHPLLIKVVNEKDITQLVIPVYDNLKTCAFNFGFGVKDSATKPGWGRYFTIEKRNGHYKIVRLSNVP